MATDTRPSLCCRFAAGAVVAAAPAVIALCAAGLSYADDGGSNSVVATPTHHDAFPGQNPQADRPWYQTPGHDNKPASTNPADTPIGQYILGSLGFPNLGPLGNLGLGNLGNLGGLGRLGGFR
jgi:hypothetical protein